MSWVPLEFYPMAFFPLNLVFPVRGFIPSVLQRDSPSAAKVSAKLHTKPINRIFLQNLNTYDGIKFAFADLRGFARSFGRPISPWDPLISQRAQQKYPPRAGNRPEIGFRSLFNHTGWTRIYQEDILSQDSLSRNNT